MNSLQRSVNTTNLVMRVTFCSALFLLGLSHQSWAEDLARTFEAPIHVFQDHEFLVSDYNYDEFGQEMLRHGDLLLIAAPAAKRIVDGQELAAGRVFLYDLNSNELLLTLDDPSPEDRGDFGSNIALSEDFALVTSRNSVELFDIRTRNDSYARHVFTLASPDPENTWWGNGVGVALLEDTFLTGNVDPKTNLRFVEVYDLETFEKVAQIDNPDRDTTSYFGVTLVVDGNRLLVGDELAGDPTTNYTTGPGAVYIFDLSSLRFIRKIVQPESDSLLYALGHNIAAYNGYALLSAHTQSENGIAEVYYVDLETGEILHTFYAENETQYWWYGDGIALSENLIFISYTNNNLMNVARTRGEPIGSDLISPRIYIYDRETKELLYEFENTDQDYEYHEVGRMILVDDEKIFISITHINPITYRDNQNGRPEHGEVRVYEHIQD